MRRSEQQLNADIKAGRLARVYMLYGEEDFLIRAYTDKLVSLAVAEEEREMNFRKYSLVPNADKGSVDDRPPRIDELSDFVDSMPFFAEHKCVLLRNFEPELLEKGELEDYLALIDDIPDTSVVIITRESMGEEPKKFRDMFGKGKMKKLVEAADRNGIICEMNCLSIAKLAGKAIKKCRAAGCDMADEDAIFLAESVGGSLSLLQTEVEKLCAYKGSSEINREDIDALVPKRIESNIYDLAKRLFEGNVGGAMEIVNALFIKRAQTTHIMSALSSHFVDLYRAKLGLNAKKKYPEAVSAFKYFGRDFVMRNAYNSARNLSEEYLGECVAILYDANKQLHSSKLDERLIIERAITEISALPR